MGFHVGNDKKLLSKLAYLFDDVSEILDRFDECSVHLTVDNYALVKWNVGGLQMSRYSKVLSKDAYNKLREDFNIPDNVVELTLTLKPDEIATVDVKCHLESK